MSAEYSDNEIQNAVKARDFVGLLRMLDGGLDANWTGASGNTLLHAAARIGDVSLLDKLFERGARAGVHNDAGETPRDIAAAWGYDAAAAKIAERLPQEKSAAPEALPYATLAELRQKSAETGVNEIHTLAKKGRFPQVLALAEKDPEGLKASELLTRGPDGDHALMKICQQGQLPLLMKPELWVKQPQEFQALWENVPAHYRKEVDYDGFVGQVRQAKLKSYGNFKIKGLGK